MALADLTKNQLSLKESLCEELLNIFEKLGAGKCKLRGLLLYELFCCKREQNRRKKGVPENDLEVGVDKTEELQLVRVAFMNFRLQIVCCWMLLKY